MRNLTRVIILLAGIFSQIGIERTSAQTATFNWNGTPVLIGGYDNYSSGALQTWTVPACVTTITVTAVGGSGGNADYTSGLKTGGLGASLTGTIPVTPGDVLNILVAGQGAYGSVDGGGGGGGSYIWDNNTSALLVVAGGGGGAGINENAPNAETLNGTAAKLEKATRDAANTCGTSGTGGNGGAGGSNVNDGSACGGSGWLTNGGVVAAGSYYYTGYGVYPDSAFTPGSGGAAYGAQTGAGGYGGGAGGGYNGGGGGGGYNGGGGGKGTGGTAGKAGGGGGSFFNNTIASSTTTGSAGSNGTVIISWTSSGVSASISSFADPTCNGGTGTATGAGSGGATPYTYSWNPSAQTSATATGLSAASYTVTVTDHGGCTATASVTLTQPTAVTAVMGGPTYPLCNGSTGSVAVTAGGGTSPYTYAWAPLGGTTATGTGLTVGSYTVTVKDKNGCSATASINITQPAIVTAVMGAPTDPLCNGGAGTAMVTAGGGTSPYTYSWAPTGGTNATGTGLTVGSYTLTVKDKNGCSATASVSITQPTIVTAVMGAPTDPLCNGGTGSATVTGGGGTSPYTYAWAPTGGTNTTGTGLTVGSYTVTVKDNNGCAATASVSITQPTVISNIMSMTTATCGGSNGTATAASSGGNSPYTYSWSPSAQTNATATGLSAGNYTVTVKDNNGCSQTSSIAVTNGGTIAAAIGTTTYPLCNSGTGSSMVNPSGGVTPYTYSWNPSAQTNQTATGLTAGSYTVTVKDNNGCIATASVSITQPTLVTAVMGAPSYPLCNGNTGSSMVTTGGGITPYTYAWTPAGGTSANGTGLTVGSYTVTVKDNNGCVATASVSITQPTLLTAAPISMTSASCGSTNGTAMITAGGGTSPYTYTWNPSAETTATATGLSAGNYTVTVKDNNGCSQTASIAVTSAGSISATLGTVTNVLCNSGSTGSAMVNPGGGTAPYTYSWNPTAQTNQTATGLSAGSYTVSVHDNTGCSATASVTITQPTVLTAVMGAPTYPLCNGSTGSATVTAGGGTSPYTYAWAPTGGTNATGTGLTAGGYTVTVKDNNGCSATASVSITQPAVVTAVMGAPTDPSCSGGTGSVTVTAGGGTGAYTYSWSPSGGSNAMATGLSAGGYTVTVKDNNGCAATASVSITQPITVTASMGAPTDPLCNGGTGSAIVTAGGGTLPYTYTWSPSGGTNATGTGLTVGSYTVTVKDNGGCAATASVSITQPTIVTAGMGAPTDPLCGGGTGSATVTAGGGTGAYTYTWAPSGGSNATGTGLTAGGYTVTVKDNNGCNATASVSITQPAVVTAVMGAPTDPSCSGGTGSVTVTAGGGTGAYTYSWSPSGGSNAMATGLSAGGYTVTVKDNNGCAATASVSITQPITVTAVMGAPTDPLCNGGIGNVTVAAGGGTLPYTYAWSPSGGTNATGTGLTIGSYTVTVKDNGGCSATASVSITQPTVLTASMGAPTNPLCSSGTGSATVTAGGGTGAYTYTWTPSGGSNASGTGLTAGSYTVTVKDNNGCAATASVSITQPTIVTATMGIPTDPLCNGGTGTAMVTAGGGTSPYIYIWAPSGGTNATGTGLTAGGYTVTVHDNNGCIATASITITQPTVVAITMGTSTYPTCNGGTGNATANAATGGTAPYNYIWTSGGGTNLTASNLSAGTYTITATDNHGCTGTASVTITQPAVIGISIASVTTVSCQGVASITSHAASGGTAPYTYSWAPSGGNTLTASGFSAGTYTITVKDNNGCSASASEIITLPPTLAANASTSSNASCYGGKTGSISVSPSGGTSPYTYSWFPGSGTHASESGLSAGTYTITITDIGGCTVTTKATITEPAGMVINTNSLPAAVGACNGAASVTIVSGGTAPYNYLWSPGSETNDTITPLCEGAYCCTITQANGCSQDICVIVETNTAVGNIAGSSSSVSIYPNPTNGQLTVSGIEKGMVIEIYDYVGRKISNVEAADETVQLNIAAQPNGIYFIRVLSKDGALVSENKVIKTE